MLHRTTAVSAFYLFQSCGPRLDTMPSTRVVSALFSVVLFLPIVKLSVRYLRGHTLLFPFLHSEQTYGTKIRPAFTRGPPFCPTKGPIVEDGNALIREKPNHAEHENVSRARVHFLSYGNRKFAKSKRRILKQAHLMNRFASISILGPSNLPWHVSTFFRGIFQRPKGGGYWIWKLFIVREALEKAKWGDFIFYADAGCTLNVNASARFDQYLLMLLRSKSGILSIAEEFPERKYVSGRILETFGVLQNKRFLNDRHYWAGALLMQKRESAIRLFDLALRLIHIDKWLITDGYRKYKSSSGFEGNRHDQSILSVARKCMGSVVIYDAVKGNQSDVPIWATRIRE